MHTCESLEWLHEETLAREELSYIYIYIFFFFQFHYDLVPILLSVLQFDL